MEMFTSEFFKNYVKNIKPLYDLEEAIGVLRAYGHNVFEAKSKSRAGTYLVSWVSGKFGWYTPQELISIAQEAMKNEGENETK